MQQVGQCVSRARHSSVNICRTKQSQATCKRCISDQWSITQHIVSLDKISSYPTFFCSSTTHTHPTSRVRNAVCPSSLEMTLPTLLSEFPTQMTPYQLLTTATILSRHNELDKWMTSHRRSNIHRIIHHVSKNVPPLACYNLDTRERSLIDIFWHKYYR